MIEEGRDRRVLIVANVIVHVIVVGRRVVVVPPPNVRSVAVVIVMATMWTYEVVEAIVVAVANDAIVANAAKRTRNENVHDHVIGRNGSVKSAIKIANVVIVAIVRNVSLNSERVTLKSKRNPLMVSYFFNFFTESFTAIER